MASTKRDQILQEAEKLAARGKLDAAVKEYRRALEQIPNDTNTLNRLGDLLVKANRISEAIDAYQKVAEHFAVDGFFLKSIAIYKKVNRLDPQRTEIYERLADLYFKQGLAVEGRQNLLTLADWFVRSKRLDEAVRIYHRLAELEPTNLQARGKLVDLLVQAGDTAGAVGEIDSLGRGLISRGMLDEAVKLYHRALDLGPPVTDFLAPCIEALVKGGRVQQGLDLAKRGLDGGKAGNELRRAAAHAFSEAGDFKSAREILEKLLPDIGERTDIIQLYGDVMIRAGETDTAKEKVLPAVDRLVAVKELPRAAALLRKLLRSSPGDVDVLERAVRVFDRREDPDLVVTAEAALADAYFKTDRRSDALELYRTLRQHDPENGLFARRFEELGGRPAPRAEEVPAGTPAPSLPVPTPRVLEVVPTPDEPEVEFVDVDLGEFEAMGEEPEATDPPPAVVPVSWSTPVAQPIATRPPAPAAPAPSVNTAELYTEAVVLAKYGLTDKAISHLQRLLAAEPEHAEGRSLLASLAGPELGEVAAQEGPTPGPAAEPSFEASFDLGSVAPKPLPPATPVAPAVPPMPTAPAVALTPERSGIGTLKIEDLEAILGMGEAAPSASRSKAPEAAASFDFSILSSISEPGPEQMPAEPEMMEFPVSTKRRRAAEAVRTEIDLPAPPAPEPQDIEVLAEAVELVEVEGDMLGGPSEDQLREVDFFIEQGLLDEAARLIGRLRETFEENADLASRQALLKARGWEETAAEVKVEASAAELFSDEEQFFDLAAELEKELGEDELVAEARGAEPSGEVSIEELFREFQRGVAEQVNEEDYDTHYNLGLAYREMGLLDEAIAEFQLSSKSTLLFVESVSLIGACYLDKGLPEEAARWYERGLTSLGLSQDVEWGLKYELARAHEVAGNTAAALAQFVELLNLNPGFRDVVDRVQRLQRLTN